jgi:diguanylate cyclase (GGDEF)-like protein
LDLRDIQNKRIILAHKKVFKGDTGHYRGPFEILKNDISVYVNLSCVPMFDTDGKVAGGITIINDITNEITAKEEMIRHAYYDILTNIPNRTLLMDKLKSFLIDSNDQEEYAALLVFDIDNFKKVNETYGHDVGDNLLKQVVTRIEKIISTSETFSRISGNKFVIFIPKLNNDEKQSQEKIKQYIDTINTQFLLPLNLAGEEYHLSFTIGTVLFNDDSASAYDLLKRSETAMYRAKNAVKGSSLFYRSSMSADIKEELMLENDIHKAIKNHEFEIHYQPQLDFEENKITGAEALVRWNHPTKGSIPPATFIPIAEDSGIIIKLEEWIFDKVLSEIRNISLLKGGFTLDHIAINVSTINFLQPLFVENLMLLVSKHKVKPEWIELEITENGVMENLKEAVQKVHELKSFGFTVSLDDFGTGYSSLAYLKELPVDTIKIDQSFVCNMHENTGDAMIVESVVAIGRKFNFKVLAEGVEDKETLTQLKSIHCDSYQGFLAHKPMPLHQLKKLL